MRHLAGWGRRGIAPRLAEWRGRHRHGGPLHDAYFASRLVHHVSDELSGIGCRYFMLFPDQDASMMQIMNDEVIDIRLLEAFAAVMSAGSMTGAARLLGRSQSVVTRQIQDLEADVGYPLFSRSGPRISPTPKGVLFHAEVERLLLGLKHIRQRAAAIGAGALPDLSLAAIPALAAGFVPAALATLERELLPRQVHLQALSAENVVQSVLSQSVDFGLASLPVQHPGLDVQWVCEVPCVACLAMDHPLAKRKLIRLKDLAGRRLITMANPYRLRRRVEAA